MLVIGLTGSIGMGKSTTARFFAEEGVPVHDADAAVHRLYAGEAAPLIEAAFPGTVTDGKVDREKLGRRVLGDPAALKRLEAIVHPLVRREEERFLAAAEAAGAPVAVLDIPLLFETGGDSAATRSWWSAAPAEMQRARVLSAAGHDRGEVRRPSRQADARCGKAPAGRFCGGYIARLRFRPRPGSCDSARTGRLAEAAARRSPGIGRPSARDARAAE